MELKINNRKIYGKVPKYLELKHSHGQIPLVKEEITREIRKYFELTEKKDTTYQFVRCT